MNVVDSSGWIEYLLDGSGADFFEPVIWNADDLVVPTISIFEVYRVVLRIKGREIAGDSVAAMARGQMIELDAELATSAAALAHAEKLGMADAIILATALKFGATIWTQDADLKRFDNVKFREKRKS
jgi:predicted nucleic acid-binding protein